VTCCAVGHGTLTGFDPAPPLPSALALPAAGCLASRTWRRWRQRQLGGDATADALRDLVLVKLMTVKLMTVKLMAVAGVLKASP